MMTVSSAYVLGIAGGSGSGKSTVVDRLRQAVGPDHLAHLPYDAYYLNRRDMPPHVRDADNWDHPDALDTALFLQHLDALSAGRPVERPEYDFATHSRSDRTVAVAPRPLVLVEGILLFAVPEVVRRLHLKVFIDTPADLRIIRRAERDITERGRTFASVIDQYVGTVRPMHDQFVEPTKRLADLVIPWEWHNTPAVQVIAARLREHVPSAVGS
jgi:uridine kinase